MKKEIIIIISSVLVCIIGLGCIICGANYILTNLIERTNIVCENQKFLSAEEAIQAMEENEREVIDEELDYCPPYVLKGAFEYEENTIIVFSYAHSYDGGFAEFHLEQPTEDEDYYYFTNITTSKGEKSICFLYLPKFLIDTRFLSSRINVAKG